MKYLSDMFERWQGTPSSTLSKAIAVEGESEHGLTARLIELCGFALLLPLCGILFFSSDPTGLSSGFPWLIAPPLLFAARYGSAWGLGCAALTAVVINLPLFSPAGLASENLVLGVGLCVLCLLVGEATSSQKKHSVRSEAENAYLRHRLDVFSADYHLLKVSHGQLEDYMSGQKLSLREALQRLSPSLSTGPEGQQACQDLMAVFAEFCAVQNASLHYVDIEGHVHARALARHGEGFDLPPFDPLLRMAVEKQQLVSVKRDMPVDLHSSHQLLAVLPLVDVNGQVYAILAIKDMPFMAFQQDNLNLLAVLGSYLGNLLTRSRGLDQSPQVKFVSDLETVVRFARQGSVQSVIYSLQFEPTEQGRTIAQFISAGIRSLDSAVILESSSEHYTIGLILPLMSEQAAHGFRARVEEGVAHEFGMPLDHVMQDIQLKVVGQRDDLNACLSFFAVHASRDALLTAARPEGTQRAA